MSRPAHIAVPMSFFALAAFMLPIASAAQDNGPALQAYRIPDGQTIELDGRITEDVWSQAVPIRDFTQTEPVEGGTPSRDTEIWVAYDSDRLYIGAVMYDDPEGILAHQKQRDGYLSTDDRFMWILDTFKDGRTGYFFETNPAGVLSDALLTGGGGGRGGFGGGGGGRAWDGIWDVRTFIRPDGWSLEIEIPFQTLNFDPESDEWGINFQRTIKRDNEEIMWRGWRRTEGLQRPVFAGTLAGLEGMSQGIGLEAVPSAIAGWKNIPTNTDPTIYPRDMSLDLNYSVTSSLRASLSINTDFAEVESDNRRVNLTRFSLRFPERRGFFLEGSGIFSFAPRSGPDPFFSRNIGISSGQQVPIQYGTRVTGQVGGTEVGFFQVGTGQATFFDEDDQMDVLLPSEQFTVARVRQPFWEQSTIGAIYTRRSASPDATGFVPEIGHTAGVDMSLNTRDFMGTGKNADMEAFFVWNSNPDPTQDLTTGDLSARGFRINFPNDRYTGHLSYREFGDDYRPTLGFVARNDFRRIEPRIGFSPRPDIDWIRKLDFSVQFRNLTELGTGILEEREWDFNVLGVDFESGDNFDVNVKRVYEFLDYNFQISDGIQIPQGEYTNWEYSIRGSTASKRKISLFGGGGWSGFWNGDRKSIFARATLRPTPGISTSLNVQYNAVELPQGDFSANVYELETQWNPTPWVSATSQFQYDDQSQLLGLFARLRWIVKPGNDIYLVYTHNWQNLSAGILDNPDLITLSRGGSIKLNYTYRF